LGVDGSTTGICLLVLIRKHSASGGCSREITFQKFAVFFYEFTTVSIRSSKIGVGKGFCLKNFAVIPMFPQQRLYLDAASRERHRPDHYSVSLASFGEALPRGLPIW